MSSPIIVWFRQDLRLKDNPALLRACEDGAPIIPLYILEDEDADKRKIGGAARWWLHHSLQSLNTSLDDHLYFQSGAAADVLDKLVKQTNAKAVFWNRCYEPWRINRDKQIKQTLQDNDIDVQSFNASLLWEPWTNLKKDKTPYRVFTPFYKKGCLEQNGAPPEAESAPSKIQYADMPKNNATLDGLSLMPSIKWYGGMESEWTPGEDGAQKRLDAFLDAGLDYYKEGRNHPAKENVSRLSPHLHWGEISPREVWHRSAQIAHSEGLENDGQTFASELGWREFSYHLLYHFPTITWENMNQRFNNFGWNAQESDDLAAWRNGQTGYPLVDAGMRELYETGYMHNRVRMIVGSFLVKNLLTHWHRGEEWFWDTLVDADEASNSASWQWIAGCGMDAAPYFRIFNPILQSEKFDKKGDYIRRFVPELKKMPDKHIHAPWNAPDNVLEYAGVTLGETYPKPIVDHSKARERALEMYQQSKSA